MRRAVLMAVATMSLFGANARADNFTFSFTDMTGTVTGEIFGLQNDGMLHAATEVLITSYPAALGMISDLNATNWSDQIDNQFEEIGGVINTAHFDACDSGGVPCLSLHTFSGQFPSNLSTSVTNTVEVSGDATFTPAPVPEPFTWILLLTVMFALAIVKRSRHTLLIQRTRTRS